MVNSRENITTTVSARDEFSRTFGKYTNGLAGMEKHTSSSTSKMNSAYTNLGIGVGSAAVAITTMVIAVKKLTDLTTKVATSGDNIEKMTHKIGQSAEMISSMEHVMKIGGATLDDYDKAITRMSKSAYDASVGLSTAKRAYDTLGISVKDSNGELKDNETLFYETAGALSKLENSTLKAALAQDIYGRGGKKLLPVIKDGVDGIKELQKEAEDLGITFTTLEAKQSADYVDAMTRMESATDGLKKALGLRLMPILTEVAEQLTTLFTGIVPLHKQIQDAGNEYATLVKALAMGREEVTKMGAMGESFTGWEILSEDRKEQIKARIAELTIELQKLAVKKNKPAADAAAAKAAAKAAAELEAAKKKYAQLLKQASSFSNNITNIDKTKWELMHEQNEAYLQKIGSNYQKQYDINKAAINRQIELENTIKRDALLQGAETLKNQILGQEQTKYDELLIQAKDYYDKGALGLIEFEAIKSKIREDYNKEQTQKQRDQLEAWIGINQEYADINYALQQASAQAISDTVSSISNTMVDTWFGDVDNMAKAFEDFAKGILKMLVKMGVQFLIQAAIEQAKKAQEAAQNTALTASYVTLAVAKKAATYGVAHTGGAIMHSGGKVLHGGGTTSGAGYGDYRDLKSDERHIIAQEGEYMQQRKAVQFYGKQFMDDVNNMRVNPNGGSTNITLQINALDGASVEEITYSKIIPAIKAELDNNRATL